MKKDFILPPHTNAAVHKKIMAALNKSTPDEIAETAVSAGIYTPEGKLTEHYRGDIIPFKVGDIFEGKETRHSTLKGREVFWHKARLLAITDDGRMKIEFVDLDMPGTYVVAYKKDWCRIYE